MYSTYPRLDAYRPVSHLWETWQDWLPESRSTEYCSPGIDEGLKPMELREDLCSAVTPF